MKFEVFWRWLKREAPASEYAPLAALVAATFAFYLWALTRYPLAYGVDGAYYVIQVKSLLEGGRLEYPESPLAPAIFAPIALAVGNITLGIKVGASLMASLVAPPIYLVVKGATKERPVALAAAAMACASPPLLTMAGELLKNLCGCLFLAWYIWALYKLAEGDLRVGLPASLIFALLVASAHVLAFAVAIAFACSLAAASMALKLNARGMAIGLATSAAAICAAASFAYAALPQYLAFYAKRASLIARPQELLAGEGLNPLANWPPLLSYLYAVFPICLALCIWKRSKLPREALAVAAPASLIGAALSLPFWSWRFILMAFIFIPLSLGVLLGLIYRGARAAGDRSGVEAKRVIAAVAAVAIALYAFQSLAMALGASEGHGSKFGPRITEEGVEDLADMKGAVPPNSAVVAPHGLEYWAKLEIGCDAYSDAYDWLWDRYDHVLGLYPSGYDPGLPPDRLVYAGEVYALYELPRGFKYGW